ncbi:hypothetical protein NP493_258g02022 [Ridgeia piscesae]|uniref:Fibrinogen C-terminal domain-containing protein n=1 Tax=Ridgeia piscesae TaxID=27915 RepID=A0AAD9NY50_RIDPI|nr:hypothetical protein NP493_258g02022 [Ridgeia piscesae]
MSGRMVYFLVLLVIAYEFNLPTVECQCTTKYCFDDDNDVDITKRFLRIHQETGSLKEETREEIGSLKVETGSLKEDVSSLKMENGSLNEEAASLREEVGSLKEEISSLRAEIFYLAPMPDRTGFYERTYNCKEWLDKGYKQSGWYLIDTPSTTATFWVYCDMVSDGGGWLVFQRRHDGSVNFARNWREYKVGFGGMSSEFWLGNDALHYITRGRKTYQLRIDMEAFDADDKYAVYSSFKIGSEEEKFRITLGSYSGTAGDTFTGHHNGKPFTTLDRDNDRSGDNCAQTWLGGWWYYSCMSVNLNGGYLFWGFSWSDYATRLKTSEMKLRPT